VPPRRWKSANSLVQGYRCKPLALVFSSFRHVVLLDHDIVLFTSPHALFASSAYTSSGSLLFRDQRSTSRLNQGQPSLLQYSAYLRSLVSALYPHKGAG
jgi:hypothetical protein